MALASWRAYTECRQVGINLFPSVILLPVLIEIALACHIDHVYFAPPWNERDGKLLALPLALAFVAISRSLSAWKRVLHTPSGPVCRWTELTLTDWNTSFSIRIAMAFAFRYRICHCRHAQCRNPIHRGANHRVPSSFRRQTELSLEKERVERTPRQVGVILQAHRGKKLRLSCLCGRPAERSEVLIAAPLPCRPDSDLPDTVISARPDFRETGE